MSQKYKAPPITEAVIEIRYAHSIKENLIKKAEKRLAKNYFSSESQAEVTFRLDPQKGSSDVEKRQEGYKLISEDGADLLIIAPSKFLVSRLAPYPGWPVLIERAKRDWFEWKKIIGFQKIQRVGVRYINRIDIPAKEKTLIKIEDYLNFYPKYPDDDHKPLTSFTMQVVRQLGQDDCKIMINSSVAPSPLLDHTSLILDIDISLESSVPSKDDDLWKLIERIRLYKNEAFERAITDDARSLFSQ